MNKQQPILSEPLTEWQLRIYKLPIIYKVISKNYHFKQQNLTAITIYKELRQQIRYAKI